MGEEKWSNLFWHQPQNTDGELKSIENNVTKDLLFLIDSPDCPKIKQKFENLLNDKIGSTVGEIQEIYTQVSEKSISEMPKEKKAYLFFLAVNNPLEVKGAEHSSRLLIDGAIEYDDSIVFLEVKTKSPKDPNQLDRYRNAIRNHFSENYIQLDLDEITWDEIYTMLDTIAVSKKNPVQQFLTHQFKDCLRVMKLTSKFYGFHGTERRLHNHELRCLINEMKEHTWHDLKFDETNKNSEAWIPLWFGGERENRHFTIWKNNDTLDLWVTLIYDDEIKKFKNTEKIKRINEVVGKICKWNLATDGQQKYGRIVQANLSEYRTLSNGMNTKPSDEFRIRMRLDKNTQLKDPKRKEFDESTLNDMIDVFQQRATLKEIQIGFVWELRYKSKNKLGEWKDKKFAYEQVSRCFEQLIPLYQIFTED